MSIDMQQWSEYYSNKNNILKMSNACKYREVVVIKHLEERDIAIRPLKVFKTEHLEFWIERLSLKKTLFDLYISNASVKLPTLTSNIQGLQPYRQYLLEHWLELVTAYDFFVDIDIDDINQRPEAETMAREITGILQQQYDNVELWDTTRGYHIISLGKFNPEFVKETIQDICCENNIRMSMPYKDIDGERYVATKGKWVLLKPKMKLPDTHKPNADTSIYDVRRIRRVPYSLHSKTGKPMVRPQ